MPDQVFANAILKKILRWLPSTFAALVLGGLMNQGSAADAPQKWQTDKFRLLDSQEFVTATRKALHGGMAGTGRQYDLQKVTDELNEMLIAELKDTRGVHIETALATLGALAGFSVQMGIRETVIKTGEMHERQAFTEIKTRNGETYYFGDLPNEALFEAKPRNVSIYSLVCAALQQTGATSQPDVVDIAKHVASTVGTERFGIPRTGNVHMPKVGPVALLNKFWNPMRNFMVVNVDSPSHWPFVFAIAAQKLILMGRGTIDPSIAADIVMETAIPMAKMNPVRINHAYY